MRRTILIPTAPLRPITTVFAPDRARVPEEAQGMLHLCMCREDAERCRCRIDELVVGELTCSPTKERLRELYELNVSDEVREQIVLMLLLP